MGSSAAGCCAVTPCNCHLHVLMMSAPWSEEGVGRRMLLGEGGWSPGLWLAQAIILCPAFVSALAPDSDGVL